jgi:hypothetical protein
MGDTNGDYRLEIILSRRAVELILENGRKDSDETSPKASVDCDFPQSSQSNTSQRWPWHIDALAFSAGRRLGMAQQSPSANVAQD